MLATTTLESCGLSVSLADNGDDGLALASASDFAVILLDIRMPGYNGYEVCRMLRERGVTTPVIVLSAKSGEYDEVEALELGADDYLRKPYSVAVLAARVQALLRRGSANGLSHSFAGITYDPETREVVTGDRSAHLTPREGQVITELIRSRESPLSRQALLEAVWGSDFAGSPNVVDVYIRYLRKKIGPDRIQTLARSGYRLSFPDATT